jgi:hypothetical protein
VQTDLVEDVAGVACVRWNPDRNGRRVSNFGDLLGPLIVAQLAGRPAGSPPSAFRGRLLAVGSILHFAAAGDVVWGAGINGKEPPSLPGHLDVRALRGPFTRCAVLASGIPAPKVYGDPALLAARIWPELRAAPDATDRPAIAVPNLHEIERFDERVRVSPIGDPLEVIREIAASGFVTGTSLHGLILADAFGVPARPIASEVEHPFKYVDYYASTGRFNVEFATSFEHALDLGPLPRPRMRLDRLANAFPSELWSGDAQRAPDASNETVSARSSARAARELRDRVHRPTPQEQASFEFLERLA